MASPSKPTNIVPLPPPLPSDIKQFHGPANQKDQLRPLYWKRLHLSSARVNVVWQHVTQQPLDEKDIVILQRLFPRTNSRSKDRKRERRISLAVVRILEPRRSQTIAIFLRGIHVDVLELGEALLALDTSAVDASTVKAACELVSHIIIYIGYKPQTNDCNSHPCLYIFLVQSSYT